MSARKFRWSTDDGATWNYEEQDLPFVLPGVDATDTVIVEAIGDPVTVVGGLPPAIDGYAYILNRNGFYFVNGSGAFYIRTFP
jgi:hypothetical protein